MGLLLQNRFGKGIQPDEYIHTMTQNKDKFMDWFNRFTWKNPNDRAFFQALRSNSAIHCLIISAQWCGDCVRNVPVILQVMKEAGIPVEIFIQEENLDLLDQFLTLGGRSIPVVIFTDKDGEVLGKWGPRPQHVQDAMIQFKQENPDRNAPTYQENLKATYAEMARRYGDEADYQQAIVNELRELFSAFK